MEDERKDWRIWRPATWWGKIFAGEPEPYPTITDICPELRSLILNHLEPRDLKMVRQVCRSLKVDTDEDLVGVSALLQPLIPRTRRYLSGKYLETKEANVEEMLAWLEQVTVKSLTIRRPSVFLFQPAPLMRPLWLRRLVLEFDEDCIAPETRLNVEALLEPLNNLEVLKISCRAPWSPDQDVEPYRVAVSRLLEAVRLGLQFKPNLDELSLVVCGRFFFDPGLLDWSVVEVVEDLPPEPYLPKGIRKLELDFPCRLYPQKAANWKSVLDGQERLERLKLDFGKTDRSYYGALGKNAGSLRHLDLHFCTSLTRGQLEEGRRIPVPQDQWLDWRELARAQNLESLSIRMSAARRVGYSSISTLNILNFDLPSLQRLELRSVFLAEAELRKIFLGLGSLTHVVLNSWAEGEQADDDDDDGQAQEAEFIERARYTCNVLAQALLLNRFVSISMIEYTLRRYPKFLMDSFPKLPNYRVTWPTMWELRLTIVRKDEGWMSWLLSKI